MSSFRFNFSGNEVNQPELDKTKDEVKWFQCEVISPAGQIKSLDDIVTRAKMFTCGDVEIGHVVASDAILSLQENDTTNAVELAEKEHSDLVTGKYEGGFKIWECTTDLIHYLEENANEIEWKDAKILDLGCGAGILGIYATMNGALVTFQDYNKEVLENVTIPNILLNIEDEDRESEIRKCKFYSGDWDSFNKTLPDSDVYDVILTSETIYNPENYNKLIELFSKRLSKDGKVYVAAKTYYFGVGGGTRQFENIIGTHDALSCEGSWKSSGGIQREILRVTRK